MVARHHHQKLSRGIHHKHLRLYQRAQTYQHAASSRHHVVCRVGSQIVVVENIIAILADAPHRG